MTTALPLTLAEADFQQTVLDFARLRHWRVVHIRQAQRQSGHWAVPYEGDPGLPDLILARDGRVILAELKRHGKHPTPQQSAWLTALGEHGRLWRPDDWNQIQEELW